MTDEFRNDHDGLTQLGAQTREPSTKLEAFPAPPNLTHVTMRTEEWTSLCPVTGQPDFCHLTVEYEPYDRCLESKSFKLYVWSWRNRAAFVERIAEEVAGDIFDALDPHRVTVTVVQAIRGGVGITAEATRLRVALPDPD
jgi:7-cyano-7-deazaguanine reductase